MTFPFPSHYLPPEEWSSSHLIFYSLKTVVKRNCVYKVHTHTCRYNKMLWRQTGTDSNDTAIIKRNCVYNSFYCLGYFKNVYDDDDDDIKVYQKIISSLS